MLKCRALSRTIAQISAFSVNYTFSCVIGLSEFDCMKLISQDKADLITLDVGLGNIASRMYSLRPLAVENYNTSDLTNGLYYYSTIVIPVGETLDPYTLRRKEVCFSGRQFLSIINIMFMNHIFIIYS